jgi:hypothetical protein
MLLPKPVRLKSAFRSDMGLSGPFWVNKGLFQAVSWCFRLFTAVLDHFKLAAFGTVLNVFGAIFSLDLLFWGLF